MEKEVKNIYQKLLEATDKLPPEAVERASKDVTRKGYDTTGYQYQYLVNVLNEVCGIGGWGMKYKILKEMEGKWANGKSYWDITAEVMVWIGRNLVDNHVEPFSLIGGHKSETYADALKGAITNGFKKTVAMFGVGKKAYEGTLDEDYRDPETPKSQWTPRSASKTAPVAQSSSPLNCDECKAVITPAERGYSTKMYGKALCRKCQNMAKETVVQGEIFSNEEQPF